MFVREAWAAICLLSQPEALMISSGSAVNSALTRNDLTLVVPPPSSIPQCCCQAVRLTVFAHIRDIFQKEIRNRVCLKTHIKLIENMKIWEKMVIRR